MKTPTIKPTAKTLVLLSVIAGLLFASTILAYTVGSRRLGSATAQLQNKQKQVGDSTQIVKRLVEAQETYLKAQGEIGFLETSVSTADYIPTLLGQLEALGKSHNLKVISVRPQPIVELAAPVRPASDESEGKSSSAATAKKKKPKPYDEMKIDIQLQGSYWCLHDFIESLTRFPKIVAVKELQMSPTKAAEGRRSPELQANLVVTAFIFKDNTGKETGKPESTPPATNNAMTTGRSNNEG
ncbi:MAG: type 4a pilus biogenesis protein PilO [Armatimonadota bacterium]